MQHTVIPSWYQREGYIKAMADLIQKELENFEYPREVFISIQIFPIPCVIAYIFFCLRNMDLKYETHM